MTGKGPRRVFAAMIAVAVVGSGVAATAPPASAAGAVPPAPAPATGPAAPVSTQDKLVAAQTRLAAVNDAITRVAGQLQEGTSRWQEGVDALAHAQGAAARAQGAAEEAARQAQRSQQRLWTMVAAGYRNPAPPTAMLVLHGGARDVTDTVHAVVALQLVQDRQQDALREARDSRADATATAQQAQQLRDADAAQERRLAAELADLKALAEQTNSQVQTASAEVERLQAQRDAEIAAELARQQAAEAARQAQLARQQAAEAARQAQLAAQQGANRARQSAATPPVAAPRAGPAPAGDCAGKPTSNYANGNIPLSALCPLHSAPGQVLRADAAAAFNRLTDVARAARGTPICVTDSYRNYATQVQLYATKPSLAAVPGTSNHGWGVAVDLCGGVQDFGSPASGWLQANAGRYGWVHPAWAEPGGSRPEPWHWEYVG